MSLEHISYSLNRQGCFLASLLKAAEPSSKWQSRTASGRAERQAAEPSALAQRTELFSLTFSSAEKEAKFRVP